MAIGIRTKVIISFASIFALIGYVGATAYLSRNILFKGMLELEGLAEEMSLISRLQLDIDRVVMPANDYLITGDAGEMARFESIAKEVEEGFRLLEASGHKGHDLSIYREARIKFRLIKAKAGDIFAIRKPVGNAKGALLMEEIDAGASDIIVNSLDKAYGRARQELDSGVKEAAMARKRADMLLWASAVLSVFAAIALTLYLSRSILRPIRLFTEGAAIIGKGDLGYRLDLRDGVEMNTLAREFNIMADRLRESYSLLEKRVEERTHELKDLTERLKELSITDGLTGLYNSRYVYERLGSELNRAERYNHQCSFIMADIDHFKHYNDTNGHLEGDNVLKRVAICIKGGMRAEDIAVRYGGEEFSVILPETGKKEALAVAERIRQNVLEEAFLHEEKQPEGALTISLGVASFPEDGDSPKGLIASADKALYKAKDAGRNRVEAYAAAVGS